MSKEDEQLGVVDTPSTTVKETKEKKSKKKKKEEKREKSSKKEVENGDGGVAMEVVEEKREKHKKKKKVEKVVEKDVAVEKSKEKKTKKEKKNKKRKREEVSEEGDEQQPVEEQDNVEKKGKKPKKDKKPPVTKQQESTLWSYTQHPTLTSLPESTITTFYKTNELNITNSPPSLRPILEFTHASFPDSLSKHLSTFSKPTVIQSACWPPILSGRDVIGIAATGSGKTLGFGVPALIHVWNREQTEGKNKKPKVLILSPTRELAMQINDQLVKFTGNVVCIYGGVPKYEQKKLLKSGAQIIVATPGRLIDLVEDADGCCDLSDVSYFVLDEADRMLDLGFEEPIRKIVGELSRGERQTVMFSATWPPSIQKIANTHLTNAVHITVGSTDLSANTSIEQRVEVISPERKESRLLELLKTYHDRKNRILIFALYKKEAARLEGVVRRAGYKVAAIHGDLGQEKRTAAIEGFRKGVVPLLIATDVAARGIDIPSVEYVLNITFPLTIEDYCHRIGRTGRAGATGISHTFFTLHDKSHSGSLINVLKGAGQTVPDELYKFGTTVKKKVDPNYGVFVKDVDLSKKGVKIRFEESDEE